MDNASGPASLILTEQGRRVGSLGPGLTSDSADAVGAVLRDDLSAGPQYYGVCRQPCCVTYRHMCLYNGDKSSATGTITGVKAEGSRLEQPEPGNSGLAHPSGRSYATGPAGY